LRIDTDGSGVIDYSEFMAATLDKRQWVAEAVGNGSEAEELYPLGFQAYLRGIFEEIYRFHRHGHLGDPTFGFAWKDACWRAFKTFDQDGSGNIDKEERCFQKIHP